MGCLSFFWCLVRLIFLLIIFGLFWFYFRFWCLESGNDQFQLVEGSSIYNNYFLLLWKPLLWLFSFSMRVYWNEFFKLSFPNWYLCSRFGYSGVFACLNSFELLFELFHLKGVLVIFDHFSASIGPLSDYGLHFKFQVNLVFELFWTCRDPRKFHPFRF